jgi:choline dehydrogenase-like flavoprotein
MKGALLIFDLEKGGQVEHPEFEVCVVGAGAAGITLAANLATTGVRTLLLEAGGRGYSVRDQDAYHGDVGEGLTYTGLYDGRFRTLGGTTTQWAGQILEIDEFVFDKRPWISGSGWPFPKSDLVPYYKRAAALEGLATGPKAADEIWHLLGFKAPPLGSDLSSSFSGFTLSTDFAALYRDALENEPNLTVYLHANACEFIVAGDNATIAAIRCRTVNGHETTFRARFFILCVGGLETCRFLLQPQSDGAVSPWNRRDLVGRHFQDHLLCYVADVIHPNSSFSNMYVDFFSLNGYRYQHKIKLSASAQQRLGTLDIAGFITQFTGGYDDMARAYETVRWIRTRRFEKLTPGRLVHLVAHSHKLLWHKIPYSRSTQLKRWSSRTALKLNVNCEQNPLSEGRITLSSKRDALGLFRAKVNWRASEQELYSVRKYVDVIRDTFERNGLGEVRPVPSLFADEFAATIRDSFHHIGGTRMATAEGTGVVDPDLRIFGTKNGYVCSTSVFPSAGFANPTHTLLALALRLSDHLQRQILERPSQ